MHAWLILVVCSFSISAAEFRYGVATADITPDYPIRLSGYAARKTESEGVQLRLFTKALALSQDNKERALILTIDNVGISHEIRNEIVRRIKDQYSISPNQIVIFSSHTHSAPVLSNAIPNIFVAELPSEQQDKVNRYTRETIDNMVEVAGQALQGMQPAQLLFGKGKAEFAKNRRTPGGPVDHDVPILVVRKSDGKPGVILANYACHCTTLQGNRNQIHGDWAGVAQREIQKRFPGSTAMISIGCGADSNPSPRGEPEQVEAYGIELATEVERLLNTSLKPLTGLIEFRGKEIDLPYSPLPSREEWEKRAETPGIVGYHATRNLARLQRGETLPTALSYLVQTWNFGDELTMVFLPGEVVVDYSLAIKREFDAKRIWVSGYANWVPCYIPSERILTEGGYEAEDSLWYYDRPARFSPLIEERILSAVRELIPEEFAARQDGAR